DEVRFSCKLALRLRVSTLCVSTLRSARCNLFYRPFCVFAHQRFGVLERAVQYGQGVHIACVAERNCNIAQVTASLGAFDGTPLEALIKFLSCNDQLLGQGGMRIFTPKCRIAFYCELIPRAHHLANITSKNPIANFFAQLSWNVIFEFD